MRIAGDSGPLFIVDQVAKARRVDNRQLDLHTGLLHDCAHGPTADTRGSKCLRVSGAGAQPPQARSSARTVSHALDLRGLAGLLTGALGALGLDEVRREQRVRKRRLAQAAGA